MLFYLFLLFLLNPIESPPHDIPLGIFQLDFDEGQIEMDIKLEAQDVEKAIALTYKTKEIEPVLWQYILEHTDWQINGIPLIPEYCSTEQDKDHYLLKINFPKPKDVLVNMTILNKCLLAEIENHSNIIYILRNGETRGFRLDKDRVKTTFDFK